MTGKILKEYLKNHTDRIARCSLATAIFCLHHYLTFQTRGIHMTFRVTPVIFGPHGNQQHRFQFSFSESVLRPGMNIYKHFTESKEVMQLNFERPIFENDLGP